MTLFVDKKSGKLFCMNLDNCTGKYFMYNGIDEYEYITFAYKLVKPQSVFVDAGAHMGTYSIILADKCKEVHSFECQPDTYDNLCCGIESNNIKNIKAHKCALGEKEDVGVLYQTTKDGGGSTLYKNVTEITNAEIISQYRIEIKNLDSFNIKNISLIKIDVEGFELNVIKGASETLKENNYPPIIFEAWNDDWFIPNKRCLFEYIRTETPYTIYSFKNVEHIFLAIKDEDFPPELREYVDDNDDKVIIYNDIETLIKFYQDNQYDKIVYWKEWYKLIQHYKSKRQYRLAYECIQNCLKLVPKCSVDLLNFELSCIAHLIGKYQEGYEACDKAQFSDLQFYIRNEALYNHKYYMSKLPFERIIDIVPDNMPELFFPSSSSIIPREKGFYINVRAVNYNIRPNGTYFIRNDKEICITRNFICELDEDFNIIKTTELVDNSSHPVYNYKRIKGFEDIRLISNNDFFTINLETNPKNTPQVCYCKFNIENGDIYHLKPLQISEEIKCEKNWSPFIKDGEIHFIYKYKPISIYKLDKETEQPVFVKNIDSHPDLNISEFRGSAGLIPYNNGYLGTIHQVYHGHGVLRFYFHRFIWLDNDLTTMKFSKIFFFHNPDIEYNVSICHSPQGLLVPFSIRDNCSKLGILSYSNLEALFS